MYYAQTKAVRVLDLQGENFGVPNLSELDSALRESKPKLVVMSHVLYNYGSILPAKEASKISHERGALFFLDASQSVGSIRVDLKEIDPDFAAGTAAKWLCGPLGLGFFFCSKRALESLEPLNYGPNSCTYKPDGSFETLGSAWKIQEGFRNWAYCFGLSSAIDLLEGIRLENVRKKDSDLSEIIVDSIKDSHTFEFLGNADPNFRTSITPIQVNGSQEPLAIVQKLAKEGIVIAEREIAGKKILRISPHFYNDEAEADRVANALKRAA
jgi:cysteine desulfurase / selenocysteine lyase